MIDPKFKDVQTGDWVFTTHDGWMRVSAAVVKADYTVKAGPHSYNRDGYCIDTHHCPTAWTYNPFAKNDKPPCEFKVGEVIAIRDDSDDAWNYRKFVSMDIMKHHTYKTPHARWKYARGLTPQERGENEKNI